MRRSFLLGWNLLAAILFVLPVVHADDTKNQDWGDSYSSGGKLLNQNRLSEPYDNFDVQHKKASNEKSADQYLLEIRKQIADQAEKQNQATTALNIKGNSPQSALTIAYPEKDHLKVTLRVKYLFDENSAMLRPGSLDVIQKLGALLQAQSRARIELTLEDELDESNQSKDIDASRAHTIFALLNFLKLEGPTAG
jgi:hypothetical protein